MKNSAVIDRDINDCISFQKSSGSCVALKLKKFIVVTRRESNRVTAPAIEGRGCQLCTGQECNSHARNRGNRHSRHIGQPDQPACCIRVCPHATNETCCHALRSIFTYCPAYLRRLDLTQRGFYPAAKIFRLRPHNHADMCKYLKPWQKTVCSERQCHAVPRYRIQQFVRTEAAGCARRQHDGCNIQRIRHPDRTASGADVCRSI